MSDHIPTASAIAREEALFTEEVYDGVPHYRPTKEADELFSQYVSRDDVENSERSRPYQRDGFMAGLLHLHLAPLDAARVPDAQGQQI